MSRFANPIYTEKEELAELRLEVIGTKCVSDATRISYEKAQAEYAKTGIKPDNYRELAVNKIKSMALYRAAKRKYKRAVNMNAQINRDRVQKEKIKSRKLNGEFTPGTHIAEVSVVFDAYYAKHGRSPMARELPDLMANYGGDYLNSMLSRWRKGRNIERPTATKKGKNEGKSND